jgi:hypothetical protein
MKIPANSVIQSVPATLAAVAKCPFGCSTPTAASIGANGHTKLGAKCPHAISAAVTGSVPSIEIRFSAEGE